MDDIAIGRLLRSIRDSPRPPPGRCRRGGRREPAAAFARSSAAVSSTCRSGPLGGLPRALDAEIVVSVRWRGAEVDRLRDEDHARVVAAVVRAARGGRLADRDGGHVLALRGARLDRRARVSPARRGTLLVVEVKTEIVSVEATLRRLDAKVRLGATDRARAARVDGPRGRRASARGPGHADRSPARRAARRRSCAASFPLRGWAARSWLASPGPATGLLLFLTPTGQTSAYARSCHDAAGASARSPRGDRVAVQARSAPGECRPAYHHPDR